jgi:hypothetical protein
MPSYAVWRPILSRFAADSTLNIVAESFAFGNALSPLVIAAL